MSKYAAHALLLTTFVVTPLAAQMRGGLPILAPSSPPAAATRFEHGFPGHFARHGASAANVYLGTPFWGDATYAEAPPVYVIQSPPLTSQKPVSVEEERKPEAPLLIELQGDHYVRRSTGSNGRNTPNEYAADASPKAHLLDTSSENNDLPATLFVFRDGHREESSDYSIISGVIYSRGNFWMTGAWSRKILIADLDLPATLQANQQRGVRFRLPSAPNEVITRP